MHGYKNNRISNHASWFHNLRALLHVHYNLVPDKPTCLNVANPDNGICSADDILARGQAKIAHNDRDHLATIDEAVNLRAGNLRIFMDALNKLTAHGSGQDRYDDGEHYGRSGRAAETIVF